MTLPKLRELAVKAKAYRPPNNCREHPIVACGACAVCLGAQRAVEDIASLVDESALELEQTWWCPAHGEYVQPDAVTYEERHDPRAGGCGGSVELLGTRRIECAEDASRIASYFGPPGDVEAFAAAVREMCNG